ncbi:hypothetical protein OPT61_g5338 [Boeremia exigua]|uniref:Uncharacterized protein n=1 Tax=Boeremia exigua TaxID=749465 RepID=A0ACC2IAS0_9PLEO|nr:hypothetical protein OPT61_g5338 [Boeremia exigua]
MKITSVLSIAVAVPVVLALPEPAAQLEKRIGNCGNQCPANKKAVVRTSYSDIMGHEFADSYQLMDRSIDKTIASRNILADSVCGKYNNGYTVYCSGDKVTSVTVPSGNNYKCTAKNNVCSATTGINTSVYRILACC